MLWDLTFIGINAWATRTSTARTSTASCIGREGNEKVRKVTNFFLRFPHKLPKYSLKKPYLYTQR